LAAAYYLLQEGYGCVIFDAHEKPGGMLQYAVPEDKLPRKVLDAEIGLIEKLGAEFRMKTRIGEHISVPDLRSDYDAVLIATGGDDNGLGLQFHVNRSTLQTDLEGVFAGGDVVTGPRTVVEAIAAGTTAAESIEKYIERKNLAKEYRLNRPSLYVEPIELTEEEIEKAKRPKMPKLPIKARKKNFKEVELGLTKDMAIKEARRCLRCELETEDGEKAMGWEK